MLEGTEGPTTARDITQLALDHPGARDPAYRARRDRIARVALDARAGGHEPPVLEYTEEEDATWRTVTERLAGLHDRLASAAYLRCRARLPITTHRIPQLRDLSEALRPIQGFRLAAIPGLVDARAFLSRLGERVMPCTQYIRHASRPEYTPEPDVVHEVVGHVPLFAEAEFASLSEELGRAAARASGEQVRLLERLYWFTLEFGLVEESGGLRAYGAGLLSSFGELPHAFSDGVERRPFVVEEVVDTDYEFSRMQDRLFVIPSFAALRSEVNAFLSSPRYLAAGG
jgi:monomeric phenylalanine-4-hydroxylase